MVGLEVAIGYLIAWVARKAGRTARRLDQEADRVIDAGLERVHALVTAKLGNEPALAQLEAEVTADGKVDDLTKTRASLALRNAVKHDSAFADELSIAMAELQSVDSGNTIVAGAHSVVLQGDVTADRGGVAIGGVTGGSMQTGATSRPDPFEPGRPRS